MNGKKFYPYRRRTTTTRKRVYRRKPKNSKPTTKMVKSIVKKEMAKDIENKESAYTNSGIGFFQLGVNTIISSYAVSLIPNVPVGTSLDNRIGLSVTTKRLLLKGFMRLNSSGASGDNPFVPGQYNVRMFIGRLKQSFSGPLTSDFNKLLRTGSAILPFNASDGLSLCRSVNRDNWTIYYDKIHKIGVSQPSNNSATFNVLSGISNNDYKLSKLITIDCTKWIAKKLKYNTASDVTPTNTGLYIFGGVVDSLASDTILSQGPPVVMEYDVEYLYEDA